MRALLRAIGVLPWQLLPRRLRFGLVKAALNASRAGDSRAAVKELLQIDAVLSGQLDLAAVDYDGGVHVKHRLMRYHDFFVERIAASDRVLDVGCGYGAVARSIAERSGAAVTGIDLNADNVSQARARAVPRLRVLHGTAPQDVPDERFDVIVLSNVLEHVEYRVAFLQALHARTKAGRFLIRVPMADRDWRVPLRAEIGLFAFSDPTHFTEYTRLSFEAEMAEAGFDIRHLQVNWGEIWSEVVPRSAS